MFIPYVQIRDGDSPTSPLITKVCGHNPYLGGNVTFGSQIWLWFATDDSVKKGGFHITYTTSYQDVFGKL